MQIREGQYYVFCTDAEEATYRQNGVGRLPAGSYDQIIDSTKVFTVRAGARARHTGYGLLLAAQKIDLEEEIPARDAEVALAFLVEQGMVEVAGDTITVPARFWSGGQVPAT